MLKSLILNGTPWPTEHAQVAVPWWSFTKTVLSAAALCLVRDGVVRLDEPVAEGPFTLRQLLKHQAGLADYSELKAYHSAVAENQAPWPAHEMLQRLDANRLRYEPGTAWRYSNVGYMWVARLIERLSGQPLEEALIQQVFFAPRFNPGSTRANARGLERCASANDGDLSPPLGLSRLVDGPA